MMNARHGTHEERGVLRWGGVAGMLGSALFLVAFGVVAVVVGSEPGLERDVVRFPEIRGERIAENSLYFGALVLWVIHFLALGRGFRATSPAPALFGSILGTLGLVVLAAGAFPHVATAPLADLYHAAGATPADQASLVLLWRATLGVFDALLITGLLLAAVGVIALAAGMLRAPAFGRRYGGLGLALGAGVLVAAVMAVVDPGIHDRRHRLHCAHRVPSRRWAEALPPFERRKSDPCTREGPEPPGDRRRWSLIGSPIRSDVGSPSPRPDDQTSSIVVMVPTLNQAPWR